MKALTCAATERRLQAFHDGELAVGDQIAVAAHLEWCSRCADHLAELRFLRSAVRASFPNRPIAAADDEAALPAVVISRIKAERAVSWPVCINTMFEDMHFVYAGFGAAAAAVVCLIVALNTFTFVMSYPGSD